MNKTCNMGVYYFSGTGNTEIVVNQLSKDLEEKGHRVTLHKIDDITRTHSIKSPIPFEMVGIAYPIYGFGTPAIINDFINRIDIKAGTKVFLLKSAADYIGINHPASLSIIRKLKKKGIEVFYDRIIIMPPNWMVEYQKNLAKQMMNTLPIKTSHMAEEITQGTNRLYNPPILLRILAALTHFLEGRCGAKQFGLSLKANKNCTDCGICIKNCPRSNISRKDGKIRFSTKCIFCMRCIYGCPAKAIYSRGMSFSILKNGYDPYKLLEDTGQPGDFVTAQTTGFFKHLWEYFEKPEV